MGEGARGRRTGAVVAGVLSVAALVAAALPVATAGASIVRPHIIGLAVSPTVAGGTTSTAVLTGTVTDATSCTLSSPAAVPGLPRTVPCPGPVSETVLLPYDATAKPLVTKLLLSATGEGITVTKAKKVKVLPGAGAVAPAFAAPISTAGLVQGIGATVALAATGRPAPTVSVTGALPAGLTFDSASSSLVGTPTQAGTTTLAVTAHSGVGADATETVTITVTPAGLTGVSRITSTPAQGGSPSTSCAVTTSGGVDCWGWGYDGELGNGTAPAAGSSGPVAVTGIAGSGTLTGVASLTAGARTLCALLVSGRVDCWGDGTGGQLGDGALVSSPTPVAVVGTTGTGTLAGVASLTADADGTTFCAVLATGGVDCWGAGASGQLGDGATARSSVPVAVRGVGGTGALSGVTGLAGHAGGFCAALSAGGASCWGFGYDGELGNGSTITSAPYGSTVPVTVAGIGGTGALAHVARLTADQHSICALLTTGGVACWGYGYYGQLGGGTFADAAAPVAVVGPGGVGTLGGATALASGQSGHCAVVTSGAAGCWGYGTDGELGDGASYAAAPHAGTATPVAVAGIGGTGALSGVSSLVGTATGYCAVTAASAAVCWGGGYYGQTGGSSYADAPAPVAVGTVGGLGPLPGVVSLSGGSTSPCAVVASGEAVCWGYGYDGELGDGSFRTTGNLGSPLPVAVRHL